MKKEHIPYKKSKFHGKNSKVCLYIFITKKFTCRIKIKLRGMGYFGFTQKPGFLGETSYWSDSGFQEYTAVFKKVRGYHGFLLLWRKPVFLLWETEEEEKTWAKSNCSAKLPRILAWSLNWHNAYAERRWRCPLKSCARPWHMIVPPGSRSYRRVGGRTGWPGSRATWTRAHGGTGHPDFPPFYFGQRGLQICYFT